MTRTPFDVSEPPRLAAAAAAALAMLLASCGSSTYVVNVRPIPATAHVFVNGEDRGAGPKTLTIEVGETDRVFLQVAGPNYLPWFTTYTRDNLPSGGELVIALNEIR